MNFEEAFTQVKNGEGMRLPKWHTDVSVYAQYPDVDSKMTAPYLYVKSRYGRVPWQATNIELFSEDWGIVTDKDFDSSEHVYVANFMLTGTIKPENIAEAKAYLNEPMTKYIPKYKFHEALNDIRWILFNDGRKGVIKVTTNRELTENERSSISSWIRGQNGDGLGEGFEQQDFAITGYDKDKYEIHASFDWDTNDYHLIEVEK